MERIELDYRIDGPHQQAIARVDAGGELLRGCEDRRDGLFVVLENAQEPVALRRVPGDYAHAVVWLPVNFQLVDQVADGGGVILGHAKDQGLFPSVDQVYEQLDAVAPARRGFDDAVEIVFRVAVAFFDLALNQLVIGRMDIVVERGSNLPDLERRHEAVIDPVFQRVGVNRLPGELIQADITADGYLRPGYGPRNRTPLK